VVVTGSGGHREWWLKGVVVGKEDSDAMYTRGITGDVPNMLTAPESSLASRDKICRD
jgi:hypothetical protein